MWLARAARATILPNLVTRLGLFVVCCAACAATPPAPARPLASAVLRASAAPEPEPGPRCLASERSSVAPASRIDETALATAFDDIGYRPPDGSHLLVGRELAGARTEFEWFSLGETGLVPSEGHYWPASTVKLITAVAALEALSRRGLTGAARLDFVDDDGGYHGPAIEIARLAVEISDNPSYNRTLEIAGFDALNDEILPAWGLRHTVFQRRYTRPPGVESLALRRSPAIRFREGDREGTIEERVGVGRHPECPADGNCTTLYELLSVMRRVVLSDELPEQERFAIAPDDLRTLEEALLRSHSRIARGATAALGDVLVYNKTGTVPGDDRLDHGLVEETRTGRRWLVAVATPWRTTENEDVENLVWQALVALR